MSAFGHRASKRRRRKHNPGTYHSILGDEQRFLHQAIQSSKLEKTRGQRDAKLDVPWAPTFYPTVEEMEGNPLHYVEKIRPIAESYGICKIVPPQGWDPVLGVDMKSEKKFQTKQQLLHRIQEGISFGDGVEYSSGEYQRMARQRSKEYKARNYPDHDLVTKRIKKSGAGDPKAPKDGGVEPVEAEPADQSRKRFTPENVERDYWDIIETHSRPMVVEYGNDVNTDEYGSGFPLSERGRSIMGTTNPSKIGLPEPAFGTEDYYKETWWNLNNIPCAPDSVLRHVKVGINGINVPWMYHGSLFTTFCWHNEDNYLYSINYHHKGAPKQWYGVPGHSTHAEGLEKVFKNYLSMKMRDVPDLLHHITTMFSPRLLQNAEVPVYKLLQHEGEYVITFPRCFHGGFSLGPNVGEAVNFATHDWIAYGSDANERYRSFARPAVFSHDRLTFTMANHLREQKAYSTCKLLLDEIERVVSEELRLRMKLTESGVRDVSNLINLPRNRLDQLDAESADYDDKRLCHAYRKYFMIWSGEEELQLTLQKVRDHCASLKKLEEASALYSDKCNKKEAASPPEGQAPGVEQDILFHKDEEINLEPVSEDIRNEGKHEVLNALPGKIMRSKTSMGGPSSPPALPPAPQALPPAPPAPQAEMVRRVSQEASQVSHSVDESSGDEEIEIVAVKPAPRV